MLDLNQLFPKGCFGFDDFWLRPRVLGIAQAVFDKAGSSFAQLSTDPSFRKGAYRLCENSQMTLDRLLTPTFEQVAAVVREGLPDSPMLCLQDTTELDLSHLPSTTGLGELRIASHRGIHLHPALVVSTTGLPLGLLGAKTFVRDPIEHGKKELRKQRRFEEKESHIWWEVLENAERLVNAPKRLVTVGDRGMDVLDVIARASLSGYRVLVRAAQDRWVNEFVEDYKCRTLTETLLQSPARSFREVYLPAQVSRGRQQAREERLAKLSVRHVPVVLRMKAKPAQRVPVWAIWVKEEETAETDDAIEWLLLTTDPIENDVQAWKHVGWYLHRWLIEEFFKALKAGCRAEKHQFETRETYENALSFMLLAAVRILGLRNVAREQPELPARAAFDEIELTVLKAHAQRERHTLAPEPTMRAILRWIAQIGGFMARASDGEPGWLTIWRGYVTLCAMVDGYLLALGRPPRLRFLSPQGLLPSLTAWSPDPPPAN